MTGRPRAAAASRAQDPGGLLWVPSMGRSRERLDCSAGGSDHFLLFDFPCGEG